MKKCLLLGFFGHRNLGDDLLYEEAIDKIPSEYQIYTNGNCPSPDDLKRENVTLVHSIRELLSNKYDLIIANGGGVFPSLQYGWKGLFHDFLLRLRSKLMVINGVGIVPKKGIGNRIRFRMFLMLLDYRSVRDNVSKTFVDELMGGGGSCTNCHDLFFGRKLLSPKENRSGVLVCMANPYGNNEMSMEHFQKRYQLFIKIVQTAILKLKEQYGSVTFLPFYQGSDEIIIKDIMQHPQLSNSHILEKGKDFKIDNVDLLFSKFKIGLCMRFHSFVLATRNCLPFVGICYDYKSESLLSEMNLSEIGIRYGIRKSNFFGLEVDINEVDILGNIDYVIEHYSAIEKRLDDCRRKFHKEVLDNYNNIYSLIKSKI